MVTDTLGDFRCANRRIATIEACKLAVASDTADRDRKNAAVVVNALVASRTLRASKTVE
jgi:hypothetical protein